MDATTFQRISRMGALVEAAPEIVELDLDPVIIMPGPGGAVVVDGRARRPAPEVAS